MYVIIVFISTFFLHSTLTAQPDTLRLSSSLPIAHGYTFPPDSYGPASRCDPSSGLTIFNSKFDSDSVFSVSQGEVVWSQRNTGDFTCVIRFNNFFYTYSNLLDCDLKKGTIVNRGDFIGTMEIEEDGNKSLYLIVMKGRKYLSLAEHMLLLK